MDSTFPRRINGGLLVLPCRSKGPVLAPFLWVHPMGLNTERVGPDPLILSRSHLHMDQSSMDRFSTVAGCCFAVQVDFWNCNSGDC